MLKYLIPAIVLGTHYIYYDKTYFEKKITVKNKHMLPVGINYYYVTDNDNNTYKCQNNLWSFINGSIIPKYELWNSFEIGKTYNVEGYGINNIGFIPKITNINKLDE